MKLQTRNLFHIFVLDYSSTLELVKIPVCSMNSIFLDNFHLTKKFYSSLSTYFFFRIALLSLVYTDDILRHTLIYTEIYTQEMKILEILDNGNPLPCFLNISKRFTRCLSTETIDLD